SCWTRSRSIISSSTGIPRIAGSTAAMRPAGGRGSRSIPEPWPGERLEIRTLAPLGGCTGLLAGLGISLDPALLGGRGGLRELVEERLDARAGGLCVLLAGAAADPHAADDLAVDDHGHAAVERRDLAAAGRRGVLEAEVEQ